MCEILIWNVATSSRREQSHLCGLSWAFGEVWDVTHEASLLRTVKSGTRCSVESPISWKSFLSCLYLLINWTHEMWPQERSCLSWKKIKSCTNKTGYGYMFSTGVEVFYSSFCIWKFYSFKSLKDLFKVFWDICVVGNSISSTQTVLSKKVYWLFLV